MAQYTYKYPRPMVCVDTVLLELTEGRTGILLIKRGKDPFMDRWALPGGFVEMDEDLEPAARRELKEETGQEAGPLIQVGAFGDPTRDPRGRNISIAFAGVTARKLTPRAADDAREAAVFPVADLPGLAFDHEIIIKSALKALKSAGLLP